MSLSGIVVFLIGICLIAGCKSTQLRNDTTPVPEKSYSGVRYDKINNSANYINQATFQRIPIPIIQRFGKNLESFIEITNNGVVVPLDNARRLQLGGMHIRIDGDTDVKTDSLSIMIVISW